MGRKQKSFSDILRLGFVEPFRSPSRLFIYFAALLGGASVIAAQLYLAFSLYSTSALILFSYFFFRTAVSTVWLVILFYLYEKVPFKILLGGLMALKLICVAVFFMYGESLMTDVTMAKAGSIATLNILINSTFWLYYHSLMISFSSGENSGNEVSIGETALAIGSLFGAIVGGFALKYIDGPVFIMGAFALLIISVICCAILLMKTGIRQRPYDFAEPVRLMVKKPQRALNSVLFGAGNCYLTMFAPVWMAAIGLSGLGTGIVIGLQSLLQFIVSPFVGHFANQKGAKESQIGAAIKMLGWLPWLVGSAQILLLPSSILWFIGNHFYNVGTTSRWYAGRNGSFIAAREISLGLGRMLSIMAAIPLLYLHPHYFFVLAISVSAMGVTTSLLESAEIRKESF